jgi:hypothetical protein
MVGANCPHTFTTGEIRPSYGGGFLHRGAFLRGVRLREAQGCLRRYSILYSITWHMGLRNATACTGRKGIQLQLWGIH